MDVVNGDMNGFADIVMFCIGAAVCHSQTTA
jgi:hypothetical protein